MSLQFHPRTGYFSVVPMRAIWLGAIAVLAGCGERERLTFPTENPGSGSGPITEIFQPDAADTVVAGGDPLLIQGRSRDPDGVHMIFFEIGGVNEAFSPLDGGGADEVSFGLQLSTADHSGDTAFVRIYAVDVLGDTGHAAFRQIRIR
jgi:hypothetical protein